MKKSTFFLVAALFCGSLSASAQDDEIKVTPAMNGDGDPVFTFNKDYKYYGILLDDETREANLTEDQYVYIGADADAGRNLYIWDSASTFVESSGVNSFGVPGGYLAYQVGNAGWSGLGYNINGDTAYDLSGINDDYTFHMALMSTGNDPVDFYLTDGSERQAHLVFGDAAAFDHDAVANFTRDGEWYNIDIPMTYLEDNFGLSFKKDKEYKDKNILCILAGGTQGFTINYDAIFFYGPKGSSTSVKEINAAEKNAPVSVYTTDGKQVSKQYAKANKGVYVLKQGANTKKVVF